MKILVTTIRIQSSPDKIWNALTDLKQYSEWNPFITESSGLPAKGETLINHMQNGDQQMTFKPRVTEVQTNRYFEWLGHLLVPGLFDGRHYFKLIPQKDGSTVLEHGEIFKGILAYPLLYWLGDSTKAGFEAMNQALKQRVEQPNR